MTLSFAKLTMLVLSEDTAFNCCISFVSNYKTLLGNLKATNVMFKRGNI